MENTNFKVYIEENTQDYGKLYVEPLERGYGDTIGNALRRLLLSSIKGVAVTAVRIDGVLHEFSTIPGIHEDVIEILMNLKHIPIKAKTEKPQLRNEGYKLLTFDSGNLPNGFFDREENPGVVTAKDLREMLGDNDFEFCGDGVLCTLEPDAHLEMEFYIEPGVGYLSAERERPSHLPIDALLTDAIFSPVKRVNYQIESARVGQSIDYERLIIEVWTNGALSPEDAVRQASTIAQNYFGHIAETVVTGKLPAPEIEIRKNKVSVKPPVKPKIEPEPEPEPVKEVPLLERSIVAFGLSPRSANCLGREGITTVGDLLERSHDDLVKVRNLGKKSIIEIETKLEELGLQLSDSESQDNKGKESEKSEGESVAVTETEKSDEQKEPEKVSESSESSVEESGTKKTRTKTSKSSKSAKAEKVETENAEKVEEVKVSEAPAEKAEKAQAEDTKSEAKSEAPAKKPAKAKPKKAEAQLVADDSEKPKKPSKAKKAGATETTAKSEAKAEVKAEAEAKTEAKSEKTEAPAKPKRTRKSTKPATDQQSDTDAKKADESQEQEV